MKIHKNKSAFTLVELIVVITILAILGTIAFISLQGYSADARDSSRISDINHIKTSLELQSLASGKYPLPDNSQQVTLSGGTVVVWYQGTVGENVTKILSRNLSEKPTDPLYSTEYIYSVTPTQGQYEVMSIYEGDMVYNNSPRPLGEGLGVRANASSNTVRIDGTYNGVYVKSDDYIIPTPSIITSLDLPQVLDSTTITSQVINRGTNIPNIGTTKITQSTGALIFNDFQVYNGVLNEESSTGAFLLAYQAIANTYNGSSLAGDGVIKILLEQATEEQQINFTKSLVLNTPTGIISSDDRDNGGETPTYSCTGTLPTQNVSTSNYTGLSADTAWQNTQSGDDCYYECIGGYTGVNCDIAPLTGWRAIDSNCDIEDITIGIQTWAGCNSTLGTGIEYTNETYCYNYNKDGNGTIDNLGTGGACGAGNLGDSNDNALDYFDSLTGNASNSNGDTEYNTIWGKLYTWSATTMGSTDINGNVIQADNDTICPAGRHVPSDKEWEILETTLNGNVNCRNATDGRLCDGLGWKLNNTKTDTNNLANRLKLPLAGIRNTVVSTFHHRGLYTLLWSSTPSSTNAYYRNLYWDNSSVYRTADSQGYGFSVRCIKD